MGQPDRIVVDANILFSALLRSGSSYTRRVVQGDKEFFVCESASVSLFKHKERIVDLSRLSEEDVVRQFYLLLRHVTVAKEELIPVERRRRAME